MAEAQQASAQPAPSAAVVAGHRYRVDRRGARDRGEDRAGSLAPPATAMDRPIMRDPPRRGSAIRGRSVSRLAQYQTMVRGFVEGLGRLDLDAETGQPDITALAGCVEPNRRDAQVAQNLRAETDLAPLPVALALRGGAVF